jgi:geranylgeranyl pyrophosphate synthase
LRTLRREITDRHKRLAEITEMIHTASLVHDDVLDECSIRRGTRMPDCLAERPVPDTSVNPLLSTQV